MPYTIGSILTLVMLMGCNSRVSNFQESQVLDDAQLKNLVTMTRNKLAIGKYDEAVVAAEKIADQQPGESWSHFLLGEVAFIAGQMKKSVSAFDEVIRIDPKLKPRLWQRGLALYYANQFDEGKKQFEVHQTFNTQDVENAVWHMLCNAKVNGVDEARKQLIRITKDTRVPMRQIHEMFAGKMTPDEVWEAARNSPGSSQSQHDRNLYYASIYNGLFYEMTGQKNRAVEMMKRAEEVNPLPKESVMGAVAHVHLNLRSQSKKDETDETNKQIGKEKK